MDQQTSPPANTSTGLMALAVLTPVFAIGILFFSVRIYTRVIPKYKLNASDYTCIISALASIISYALFVAAVRFGFGRHSYYITPENGIKIKQLLLADILAGTWVLSFARISIGYFVLQFTTSTAWRTVLWLLISLQIAWLTANNITALIRCRPINANWEEVPKAQCFDSKVSLTISYAFAVFSIACDFIFAIMPILLIWKLTRSVMERCLISFSMAMSLLASVPSMWNLYLRTVNPTPSDPFRAMVLVFLLCRMDGVLLLLACTAPLIKAPVLNVFYRLGLPMFRNETRDLNSFHSSRFRTSNWNQPLEPTLTRQEMDEKSRGQQGMETEITLEAGKHTAQQECHHSSSTL